MSEDPGQKTAATAPRDSPGQRSLIRFSLLLVGEVVSMLGSGLTSFALGVWVYQQTGEVSKYALIGVVAMVPALVVSPLAGVLVDRVSRKQVLLVANFMPALTTLAALLLYQAGLLSLWHILVIAAVNSVCGSFVWLAFTATTTLLVPVRHLGRASGMVQAGHAVSQIAAPALAGVLVERFGLAPVLTIDSATFVFAVALVAFLTIPRPERADTEPLSLRTDLLFGVRYIGARAGLRALLLYFAAINFAASFALVLLTPLVLQTSSAAALGTVLSAGGAGMLAGSLVISGWGGPRRKVPMIIACGAWMGLLLVCGGLVSSPYLLGAGAFAIMFSIPLVTASSQVIWQVKVPPDVQGRVFSVRGLIATSTMPLAYLIVGPLADGVFEPAMATGGWLAPGLGWLFGTGPGRGMSVMLSGAGLFAMVVAVVATAAPRLRRVEVEVPDAVVDDDGSADPTGDDGAPPPPRGDA